MHIKIVDVPCGCGCPYEAHGTPDRPCATCATCPGWRMSDADRAAMTDRELAEIIDYAGVRTAISTAESGDLLLLLLGFEEQIAPGGWDQDPMLLLAKGVNSPIGPLGAVALEQLPVPPEVWVGIPDQAAVIGHLADAINGAAARSIILNSGGGGRYVGCVHVCEGFLRGVDETPTGNVVADPEAVDECRMVSMIDIDERMYSVMRKRSTGEVTSDVQSPRSMRRTVDNLPGPMGAAFRRTHLDGLPRVAHALRALVRSLRGDDTP